jgi:hypothetical protein
MQARHVEARQRVLEPTAEVRAQRDLDAIERGSAAVLRDDLGSTSASFALSSSEVEQPRGRLCQVESAIEK